MRLLNWLVEKCEVNKFKYRLITRGNRKEESGYFKNTQIVIEDIKIRAVQVKKINKALIPDESIDAVVVREGEEGKPYLIIPYSDFQGMLLEKVRK